MVLPAPRNQGFRRLTVEMADWTSYPAGVFQVNPASTATGISATLKAALNNAGVQTTSGVLAWRMFDTDGRLVQGGEDACYRFEFLLYVRTAPGAGTFPFVCLGLIPHKDAAASTTAGTATSAAFGISWSAASPRAFQTVKAVGGGASSIATGAAGGYAGLDKFYSVHPVLRANDYMPRLQVLYEGAPSTYKFDDQMDLQATTLGPSAFPNAWRVYLAFGSFGGALAANQALEVDAYYRATRVDAAVP